MLTVVVALISFAVAFVAGGVLSKAYFSIRASEDAASHALDEQRQRYRKRIDTLQRIIRRHEESLEQIRAKVHEFQQRAMRRKDTPRAAKQTIADRECEIAELRKEIASLRETDDTRLKQTESIAEEMNLLRIERDELAARVRRLEAERQASSSASAEPQRNQDSVAGSLRAELGEMREGIGDRDRQIIELRRQLDEREEQVTQLSARLESWKQRVAPLTARLRKQRDAIHHYRRLQEDTSSTVTPSDSPGDDLKQIRGIGPALERRLRRHGIQRFEQIAAMSEQELAQVSEQLAIAPNLAQRDGWVEQARELLDKRTTTA